MKNCFRIFRSFSTRNIISWQLETFLHSIVLKNGKLPKLGQLFWPCSLDLLLNFPPEISLCETRSAVGTGMGGNFQSLHFSSQCISSDRSEKKYSTHTNEAFCDNLTLILKKKNLKEIEKKKKPEKAKTLPIWWTRTCSEKHVRPYGFFPFTTFVANWQKKHC